MLCVLSTRLRFVRLSPVFGMLCVLLPVIELCAFTTRVCVCVYFLPVFVFSRVTSVSDLGSLFLEKRVMCREAKIHLRTVSVGNISGR